MRNRLLFLILGISLGFGAWDLGFAEETAAEFPRRGFLGLDIDSTKPGFLMRLKICRKEAKENRLFLQLLDPGEKAPNLKTRSA
jgi:hypothetical protein